MQNALANGCMYWEYNFEREKETQKCFPISAEGWNNGNIFSLFLDSECVNDDTELSVKF